MRNPGKAVKNPMRYWCDRKKTYGLLCMGAADADRRILWWDISYVPTTHDNPAFRLTPFGSRLYSGHMPAPFFASGDNAFTPHPSCCAKLPLTHLGARARATGSSRLGACLPGQQSRWQCPHCQCWAGLLGCPSRNLPISSQERASSQLRHSVGSKQVVPVQLCQPEVYYLFIIYSLFMTRPKSTPKKPHRAGPRPSSLRGRRR